MVLQSMLSNLSFFAEMVIGSYTRLLLFTFILKKKKAYYVLLTFLKKNTH